MEYYSAVKRNTFESVLMRWVNLEPIMQSEVSQKGKIVPKQTSLWKRSHSQCANKCESNTAAAAAKSLQSCPTLCNPIDGSPPGSTIPGILQARTLEWVAISFSNA